MSLGDNVLFYAQSFEAGRKPKDDAAQAILGGGVQVKKLRQRKVRCLNLTASQLFWLGL